MTQTRGLSFQNDSDAAIVARVLAGDTGAYAVIVARYRVQYGRYAVRMLGSREDAEEALQDAFVRAFRSLAKCDEPERFAPWFFRILANRCRTAGTRRGRRERTFVNDEIALLSASEDHPAERAAWREELDRALQRLETDQRPAPRGRREGRQIGDREVGSDHGRRALSNSRRGGSNVARDR